MLKKSIWVTSNFIGFHKWPDAPEDVGFLRDFHRHIFYVKMQMSVTHSDRDLEFFQVKRKLDNFLRNKYHEEAFCASCEMIAESILHEFGADIVEVSEDNENGGRVERKTASVVTRRMNGCFTGIEAEGPNRGESAFFIPASTPIKEIEQSIAVVRYKVSRAYFGAGNDRPTTELTNDMFSVLVMPEMPNEIDIEVAAPLLLDFEEDFLPKLDETAPLGRAYNIIAFFNGADRLPVGPPIRMKNIIVSAYSKWVEQDTIYWKEGGTGKIYATPTDDPLFGHDRKVEIE